MFIVWVLVKVIKKISVANLATKMAFHCIDVCSKAFQRLKLVWLARTHTHTETNKKWFCIGFGINCVYYGSRQECKYI